MTDADFMGRALFHAARACGVTTPNPMVGAIVVTPDGVVVGQGRHPRAGEPHAEVFALEEAGERARGATLYVTLEPCSHHGRTPPCAHRIVEAGIRRVVAAMIDPNPHVNGRGIEQLRANGIVTEVGLRADEAARLNRGFITVQTAGRPMVVLKVATSLDARMAAEPGACTRLTSGHADRRTHRLRASVDAVGVGSGTILADDPLLTARQHYRARPLVRVVFDRRLRTPPSARVFSTLHAGPVIILAGAMSPDAARRAEVLRQAGATILNGTGRLEADLGSLVSHDVSTLLLEGGARLHAAAWQAQVVDRVHLVVAPAMLGERGVKLFDGLPVPWAAFTMVSVEPLGRDVWMEADVYGHH